MNEENVTDIKTINYAGKSKFPFGKFTNVLLNTPVQSSHSPGFRI
jgi:hypothetical protein